MANLLRLTAITIFTAGISFPITESAYLFGDWWTVYKIHFGMIWVSLSFIYTITVIEAEETKAEEGVNT